MFFDIFDWNVVPLDGTYIALLVMALGRWLPFPIELSPESSRKVTSEVQQALVHFEAAYPLMFI